MLLFGSVIVFVASVAFCLMNGWSMAWAMLIGYSLLCGTSLIKGTRASTLYKASVLGAKDAVIVIEILLLIGLLTASWRISGVIAFFVYYGIGMITPKLFILTAFLLTCVISYALGTSVGVAGTAGVILMAIARSGGVNEMLAAGAILSGVYFGDRCSPTASSANLVAALTKTDLYGNVDRMLKTAAIPTAACVVIYCVLSFMNPLYVSNANYLSHIRQDFVISWWAIVPVAVMFVFPMLHIPVKYALAASTAASFAIAGFVQGTGCAEMARTAIFGYAPEGAVMGNIWDGGGLLSMIGIITILTISSTYSKIMAVSGILRSVNGAVDSLRRKVGGSLTLILSSFFTSGIFCSQISSCIMTTALMKRQYEKRGRSREEFALDIENSLIIIAPMVPWCLSCSVPLKLLGVNAAAIRWEFYIFLIPICYFAGKELRSRRGHAVIYLMKRRFIRPGISALRW